VGNDDGKLVGSVKGEVVGRELVGLEVGGLVSPCLVGLDVIGASVGEDDG
jgi:hypothetical protein